MNSKYSSEIIKAEAKRLGFFACGIAKADLVNSKAADELLEWIKEGKYASMEYLKNYIDKKLDPRLLMDGLKSIVCVAMNYAPQKEFPKGEFELAAYAYGLDYHDIMKGKLHQLAANLNIQNYRVFVDTGPVLERYWAEQAGLGWIGKNQQLIIPHAGSMFFLGELFIDFEVEYDKPQRNRCGKCRRCIDACPTQALVEHKRMDAEKCLSYQTIENRGEIKSEYASKLGNMIYGCDRCQKACPWNRFSQPSKIEELQPKEELLNMTKEKWRNLSIEDYRRLFKGSAVKRAKYDGLMRNIAAADQSDKYNKQPEN